MSSFICDDRHISALATFASENNICDRNEAEALAIELHAENVRSVNHRYSESDADAFTFERVATAGEPVRILKAVHCYQYQACEHEGWADSHAAKVCEAILSAACRQLKGYSDAAWGY